MAPRRNVLLASFALFVAIFSASSVVHAQTSSVTTVTTTNSTAATSFCEQCRDSGVCTQAYKGSPGIFCGNWLSASSQRLACCCPASAQCAKSTSNYECKCQAAQTTKPSEAKSKSKTWIYVLIGVVVVCLVGATIFFCAQRTSGNGYENENGMRQGTFAYNKQPDYVVAHQPAYGQPAPVIYGGAPQPMYQGNQYPEEERRGFGGGAVVAGAAAGMLGGLIVGDMLADAGHHGGSSDNHGGGDDTFAGDF